MERAEGRVGGQVVSHVGHDQREFALILNFLRGVENFNLKLKHSINEFSKNNDFPNGFGILLFDFRIVARDHRARSIRFPRKVKTRLCGQLRATLFLTDSTFVAIRTGLEFNTTHLSGFLCPKLVV